MCLINKRQLIQGAVLCIMLYVGSVWFYPGNKVLCFLLCYIGSLTAWIWTSSSSLSKGLISSTILSHLITWKVRHWLCLNETLLFSASTSSTTLTYSSSTTLTYSSFHHSHSRFPAKQATAIGNCIGRLIIIVVTISPDA